MAKFKRDRSWHFVAMFTQKKTTLKGKRYNVVDAVCNPRPIHKPGVPPMIGGRRPILVEDEFQAFAEEVIPAVRQS